MKNWVLEHAKNVPMKETSNQILEPKVRLLDERRNIFKKKKSSVFETTAGVYSTVRILMATTRILSWSGVYVRNKRDVKYAPARCNMGMSNVGQRKSNDPLHNGSKF